MSGRFELSDTDKRVHAELLSLADSKGFVAISIRRLAIRLGLTEIVTGMCLNSLAQASALAVAKASHRDKPKTYRVICEEEMLARQEAGVITLVPRQPKHPRPPGKYCQKGV